MCATTGKRDRSLAQCAYLTNEGGCVVLGVTYSVVALCGEPQESSSELWRVVGSVGAVQWTVEPLHPILPMDVTSGSTHGIGANQRIQQALVSSFPPAFDFTSDITSIDKATTFMRQVDSALRTRGLLEHLIEDVPSLTDVITANGGDESSAGVQQAQHFLDIFVSTRQQYRVSAADVLQQTIKWTTLFQHEKDELNAFITSGDGVGVYRWLQRSTDLSVGEPQDKIRRAYSACKVKTNDQIAALSTAVEMKWWLAKQNTLIDTTSTTGVREAITDVLTMLLEAHSVISSSAAQQLTTVDTLSGISGDRWVTNLVQMWSRHGDKLMKAGQLTLMGGKGDGGKGDGGKGKGGKGKGTHGGSAGCNKHGCQIRDCIGEKNDAKMCILQSTESTGPTSKWAQDIAGKRKNSGAGRVAEIEYCRQLMKEKGGSAVANYFKMSYNDRYAIPEQKALFEKAKGVAMVMAHAEPDSQEVDFFSSTPVLFSAQREATERTDDLVNMLETSSEEVHPGVMLMMAGNFAKFDADVQNTPDGRITIAHGVMCMMAPDPTAREPNAPMKTPASKLMFRPLPRQSLSNGMQTPARARDFAPATAPTTRL